MDNRFTTDKLPTLLHATIFLAAALGLHGTAAATEPSKVVAIESRVLTGNEPNVTKVGPDTAMTVMPEKIAVQIEALTNVPIPRTEYRFTIMHNGGDDILCDIAGGSGRMEGEIFGVKNSLEYSFIELLSAADDTHAYGLGAIVVTNYLEKKSCLVLVEADLQHNVRPGNKQVEFKGGFDWFDPVPIKWNTPDDGLPRFLI